MLIYYKGLCQHISTEERPHRDSTASIVDDSRLVARDPVRDYSTELTIGHYRVTDPKPSAHLGDSEDRFPTEFDPLEW